ncbi:N-acetylmuramoyl-L-alanine amidase [Streptomyces sp. JJ36]|uniref:N-acetylmuramoyl-L-alanine amidase n=1 Tax=Streptomyces sp. JJ36 TaxID=2736645 RepID=UPI001F3E8615|nr:N-acetylmuramoyl-L-alanine amidase [Streptomyces sp. JJ36]MCF6526413.1 N-acetylmuramoyl-L-alanine amidase [Streptomyces sp. JJ36]
MPYARPPRPLRTLLLVAVVLLPLCGAGWLAWRTAGPGGDRGPGPAPDASPTRDRDRQGGAERVPSPDGGASPEAERPLRGRTIVLDPGHNPSNHRHPEEIARRVDVGTHRKACDTTGTESEAGYPEARFTLDLARRVRDLLERRGARVRLTQDGDRPWGPCIDERAALGNRAGADAAVSLHADGSAPGDRGFHVILPASVREGRADTTAVVGPSRRLGEALAARFGRATGTRPADYTGGGDGLVTRDDLGGLNLTRVPKVFLECGNMRDPRDAALLGDAQWRGRAARGVADGIADFLLTERSQKNRTPGNRP